MEERKRVEINGEETEESGEAEEEVQEKEEVIVVEEEEKEEETEREEEERDEEEEENVYAPSREGNFINLFLGIFLCSNLIQQILNFSLEIRRWGISYSPEY